MNHDDLPLELPDDERFYQKSLDRRIARATGDYFQTNHWSLLAHERHIAHRLHVLPQAVPYGVLAAPRMQLDRTRLGDEPLA